MPAVEVYVEDAYATVEQEHPVIAASDPAPVRCRRRAFFALIVTVAVCGSLLVSATPALADCGDSIDGERVPCRCGDVVIADTRLQPSDPVVTDRCPADGLFVRAPVHARTILLDLNGQEIRGSGVGSGIRVLEGGSEGAEIVGGIGDVTGVVSGFREGVRSRHPGDLRLLTNVVVRESRDSGIVVRGNGTAIESVRVESNGGEGLRISGRAVDLQRIETHDNGGQGIRDHARAGARDVTSQGDRRNTAVGGRGAR